MPNSILLKVTKIEQVMLITFWVIEKNEEGGGAESAPPPVWKGLRKNFSMRWGLKSPDILYLEYLDNCDKDIQNSIQVTNGKIQARGPKYLLISEFWM